MIPIPILLNFVKYWKYGVIGLALAVIVGLWVVIGEKNETIDTLNLQLEVKEIQVESFIAAIEHQNNEIQKLVAEGEEKAKKVQESQIEIAKLSEKVIHITEKVNNEKIGESCEETMTWMIDKAGQL